MGRNHLSTKLLWLDNTGYGPPCVSASRQLFYREGALWKPVMGEIDVAKLQFNTLNFLSLTTTAPRRATAAGFLGRRFALENREQISAVAKAQLR